MQAICDSIAASCLRRDGLNSTQNIEAGEAIITVWLVDENEVYRNTIASALAGTTDLACEREFPCVESMLDTPELCAPADVILLGAPGWGEAGATGLRQLRTAFPAAAVLVLSDSDDPGHVSAAILEGASGYLLKSSGPPKILESIREVHAGGASMSPKVARSVLEMFRRMAPAPRNHGFTPQEHKVAELMTRGLLMKEIADALGVSYHTVDSHLRNIYSKLQVHSRASAVARILREGLM